VPTSPHTPSDQSAAKETVRQRLAHWQQDADLAAVRAAIDELPETERAAWRQLWQDVQTLRAKTEVKK
jgi:phosphoglycerate-specific signal transduction histidine kinase